MRAHIHMYMQTVSKIHNIYLEWAHMCTIILKVIYPHIDNYLLYYKKSCTSPVVYFSQHQFIFEKYDYAECQTPL